MSPATKNEILKDMAIHFFRSIVEEIKKPCYYSTMPKTKTIINTKVENIAPK